MEGEADNKFLLGQIYAEVIGLRRDVTGIEPRVSTLEKAFAAMADHREELDTLDARMTDIEKRVWLAGGALAFVCFVLSVVGPYLTEHVFK